MECPNCGASIPAGRNGCIKCGSVHERPVAAAQPSAAPVPAPPIGAPPLQPPQAGYAAGAPGAAYPVAVKSRIVAGIFGLLFGPLGVHNLYLGKIGLGIAQLLLTVCTCGWGLILTWPWTLIESIVIFTGGVKDGQGRPLS